MGTPQPTIASQEIEFDGRNILGVPTVDWAELATWPDTSGQSNDATGAGSFRRFENKGFGGTQPDVRLLPGPQDHYSIPGTDLSGTGFTLFAVLDVIDITSHLAIIGSDGGASPDSRIINLFVLSTGQMVFDRNVAIPYDCVSATGVIIAGTKYVITARFSTSTGMIIRVNGVEVANEPGRTQSQTLWFEPSFGVVDDQSTGGAGRIFGEKKFVWAAGYGDAASDTEITDMEGFLGDLFTVPGVSLPATSKPSITSPEFEYDVNALVSPTEADVISTWNDTSGEGNDATATGSPEYEAGAWGTDNLPDVRFTASGQATFDGTGFVGQDFTAFFVFRTFDLTNEEVLIGGSVFTDFNAFEVFIRPTGQVSFSFGSGAGPEAVQSATGEIVADGTCYVLTVQFTSTGGKLIRKAVAGVAGSSGSQIAINVTGTSPLGTYPGARLADLAGLFSSNYMKLAWVSANLVAASVPEMEQMETFLLETFCGQAEASFWTPCDPPVSTVWAAPADPSTVWSPS